MGERRIADNPWPGKMSGALSLRTVLGFKKKESFGGNFAAGEIMENNYVAVLVAALVGWMVGAAWYGILGKQWMTALEWSDEAMSGKRKIPIAPMLIAFVALLIMAYMLSGVMAHMGPMTLRNGMISGALLWLGFSITTMTVNNAFQLRKPMLTVIDGGHWLAVLLVQGAIIGAFG